MLPFAFSDRAGLLSRPRLRPGVTGHKAVATIMDVHDNYERKTFGHAHARRIETKFQHKGPHTESGSRQNVYQDKPTRRRGLLHRPLLGPQTRAPGRIRSAAALLPVARMCMESWETLKASPRPGAALCASARTSSVVSASSAATSSAAREKSKTSTSALGLGNAKKLAAGHLQVPGILLDPGRCEALENDGIA